MTLGIALNSWVSSRRETTDGGSRPDTASGVTPITLHVLRDARPSPCAKAGVPLEVVSRRHVYRNHGGASSARLFRAGRGRRKRVGHALRLTRLFMRLEDARKERPDDAKTLTE